MKQETEYNFDDKIIWLRGLVVECPMRDCADDCPLKNLRKHPLNERMEAVNKMSDEEIDKLLEHHKICIHRREA